MSFIDNYRYHIKNAKCDICQSGEVLCFVLEGIDYGEQGLNICKKHLQDIIDKME